MGTPIAIPTAVRAKTRREDRARLVGTIEDERKSVTKIPLGVLSEYVGTYDVGPLGNWTVSVVGDQLAIELADGGGQQRMLAQSDKAFVFPTVGGTVTFGRDAKGVVNHLVLTIVEGDFTAVRKSLRAPMQVGSATAPSWSHLELLGAVRHGEPLEISSPVE